jgi:glycosyltransferase involved in cell wall biosynthesis
LNATLLEHELQEAQRSEKSELVKDQVSILIRTLNRPIELERALASVVMQTQRNIELIIVNEGHDLVDSILVDGCKRDDISWRIINTNGLGRSCAANIALGAATGEFGLFLDDDDTIEPEHLEKLFYALRHSNFGCVATYTGTRWVKSASDFDCRDEEIKLFELLIRNKLPIHSVLFDLSVVKRKHIHFDETLSLYEDWDFWLQLGAIGDFLYVPGCSAIYNLGNGSGVHELTPSDLQNKVNLIRTKWANKIPIRWFAQFMSFYEEKEYLIDRMNRTITELEKKNNALEEKVISFGSIAEELRLTRVELQDALKQLSDRSKSLDLLQVELDQLYASRSWRYTYPLRYGFRIAKSKFTVFYDWIYRKLRQSEKLFYFGLRVFKNIVKYGFAEAISEAKKEPIWSRIFARTSVAKTLEYNQLASNNPFHAVVKYSANGTGALQYKKIAIGTSSQGNFFMREIGRLIGSAFLELGCSVEYFDEREISTALSSDLLLLIAPHEFFLLCTKMDNVAGQILKHVNLVLLNTEQPQTQWFNSALNYFDRAKVVWDMSFTVAVLLRSKGINAYHLPLGFCQTYQDSFLSEQEIDRTAPLLSLSEHVTSLRPANYRDRPIDILFVGTISPKRSKFFAKNANVFSRFNCFFYLPEGDQPFIESNDKTINFNQLVGLAMRSKIVLNIHRDDETYFEWQRIVNIGVFSKALVISESCDSNPFIKPNLHYVDAPLELIPELCFEYLQDMDKSEEFSERAYNRLSGGLILKDKLAQILGGGD